jgi:aminomethyltransferase
MKRTALYECHKEREARFVDFGGWEMPVQYIGIQQEHHAVRQHAGLFDVSHMGEVIVTGDDAVGAVNTLITNDLEQISDGQACYTAMCNPEGGIVDDLVVYRMNRERVLICVNASNRHKDFQWIVDHLPAGAIAVDESDAYAQIALQGPQAEHLLAQLTSVDLKEIGRYWFNEGEVAGCHGIISRTGYTGEDGFELYMPAEQGPVVWRALLNLENPPQPCGLGARDTLRLEYKYALYGNDIDETTTPLEACLGWLTKLNKPHFIGREALVQQKESGIPRALVAFKMLGRAIPRQGYEILDESGEVVGRVTSGTKSPSFGVGVGLGYVSRALRKTGTRIKIQVRKRVEDAEIVKLPLPFE